MHKSLKKFTKFERAQIRQEKLKNAMSGEGRYVFQNNTSGELELPKLPLEGITKKIAKGAKFIGDNYFMQMVRTNDLKLIEEIKKPMEKLITEQPPVVTTGGAVEFVTTDSKKQKLTEEENKNKKDVLLTEDPLGGVVIVD
jgi:hypothetical protein